MSDAFGRGTTTMERRKGDRRDLKLTCYVEWPTHSGSYAVGVSENISRNGILLRLADATVPAGSLEVGRNAIVEVQLPAEHALLPRCIHGEGRIVRVGNRDDKVELALRFSSLDFRDLGLRYMGCNSASAPKYLM